MRDFDIDPTPINANTDPSNSGGGQSRQDWVRANYAQIFGTSTADLRAQGIDPRQYAREHRDQIRHFAQMQRSQGIVVPDGRPSGDRGPGPGETHPRGATRGYRPVGRGRFGMGMRGGSVWIGILISLLALRFLLVDSIVGTHAAFLWVLEIGGIMLVARVVLFSWLRKRRFNRGRWDGQQPNGQSGL
jgi:hypothetical protein